MISVCYWFQFSFKSSCPINSLSHMYSHEQEQLECFKRGWELKHLQKLKEEDEEQQLMEGDDLFTYTREDAYNMVRCLFQVLSLRCHLVLQLFSSAFIGVRVWSWWWPHGNHAGKSPACFQFEALKFRFLIRKIIGIMLGWIKASVKILLCC